MSDNNPGGRRGGTGTLNWENVQEKMEEGARESQEPLKETVLNRLGKRDSEVKQDGAKDVAQGAELEKRTDEAEGTVISEMTPDELDDINH